LDDILRTAFRPASAEVIYKDFGDELVVANLDTGLFYSLSGSAGVIWAGLVAGHNGAEIASAFAGQETEDVAAAIGSFIADLVAEGLLVHTEPDSVGAPAPMPHPFVAPAMERFDDLQDILLLDPIHDLGATAWPTVPQTTASTG
jgi:hypothetical protein